MRAALGMLGLVLLGASASAQTPGDGKALFHEKCAMCHGPGGMGTGLLARRVDPKVAELEKRDDLTPDYVTTAARTGIGNMPAISRGEVSDRQLAAIAAYLARGKK
ncbi:c-type cytochrome [Sphingomonas sp. MMS24-J13]|uniref:c-type cytochrome n=1 Tax=Sphingomonas sp. MMS24-J13 TaxID=3238686 RepID=UPI003850AFED